MLVGEPGIGKTAVCDQLSNYVSAAGGLSIAGHCYEEGSFRPPQVAVLIHATLPQVWDSGGDGREHLDIPNARAFALDRQ